MDSHANFEPDFPEPILFRVCFVFTSHFGDEERASLYSRYSYSLDWPVLHRGVRHAILNQVIGNIFNV
jgi:hypothetical protein